MSTEDGTFLAERADRFRALARELLDEGDYELAAFHFHQAAELRLKFELFRRLGDHPRTHALKQLLDQYGQAAERDESTDEFLEDHIDVLSNLENAYITSRYLPGDFREKEVEHMRDCVTALWAFLKEADA